MTEPDEDPTIATLLEEAAQHVQLSAMRGRMKLWHVRTTRSSLANEKGNG
jgi:hypothetical protein